MDASNGEAVDDSTVRRWALQLLSGDRDATEKIRSGHSSTAADQENSTRFKATH